MSPLPFDSISSSCCYNEHTASTMLFTSFSSASYNEGKGVDGGGEVLSSSAINEVCTMIGKENFKNLCAALSTWAVLQMQTGASAPVKLVMAPVMAPVLKT
ncbi:hypothetical protein CHARACLAT_030936 [Characodon lateralis]|uniref:Uncharacterized protein n=1 Tax=Characodon lateralis TaxID=208331 RepID=A0ABU7D5G5_9TELE|nr:hypothetical protein [Characodon lateralis]